MRKLTLFMLLIVSGLLSAQDTLQRKISIIVGGNIGAGFTFTTPPLDDYYGGLMHENEVYVHYSGYIAFLAKEQFGFRLSIGRIGRMTSTATFDGYAAVAYPGYHYLPEYSDLTAGYFYNYFTPEFTYRLGSEPFNLTGSIGAGIGKLQSPQGNAVLQEDGSNNFTVLHYSKGDSWQRHAEVNLEGGYMRQLSQHLFVNAGLYANAFVFGYNLGYFLAQSQNGMPTPSTFGQVRQANMIHFNTGIFLNFQWNKRESERAYYE